MALESALTYPVALALLVWLVVEQVMALVVVAPAARRWRGGDA